MYFHIAKFIVICFEKGNWGHSYKLEECVLENSDSEKVLGVIMGQRTEHELSV